MNTAAKVLAARTSAAPATVVIGSGDPEQLRLDEFAQSCNAGQREGLVSGIAQHEAKGRGAGSTERDKRSGWIDSGTNRIDHISK